MIHVTNLLQLQTMLPHPFNAIVQKSRYNDGIQQAISSDRSETLLLCVWQGRRAKKQKNKKMESSVHSYWPEGQNH